MFLSNGPGDPAAVSYAVKAVERLLGKVPVFGICLGHQLLAQALGMKTFKLKFGHRGANHPVKDLRTGVIEITTQNHGFAVKDETVPGAEITHLNLNDGTVEGVASPERYAFSVQYHPESTPGPARLAVPLRAVPRRDRQVQAGRGGLMPRRDDLHKILIIGSGPIVIGQACEFDYSGTQACKVLLDEGYEVVLVNSNPATIMTDPAFATRTYIEPLDLATLTRIIEVERPDALLPTLGGQTALNLAMELKAAGVLDLWEVEMIGADEVAIHRAEDRLEFRNAMDEIGLRTPRSMLAETMDEAEAACAELGLPLVVRPAYTLGGSGGGIAYDHESFVRICEQGLSLSPISQVLLEESVVGWHEFELEVMRDHADNVVIICSIENIDPMGVHTGDSVTVAPALTLTDAQYQELRDASKAIIRKIGVATGGSNVQFAVNPETGEVVVIEMNPRVSRSSALASKATGFPIAKIAARLAVGYTLDEIDNDITRKTPACFEPTLDYVVVKMPRWAFEKFPLSRPRAHHAHEERGRGHGHRPHLQGGVPEGDALARAGHARRPAVVPTGPAQGARHPHRGALRARVAGVPPEDERGRRPPAHRHLAVLPQRARRYRRAREGDPRGPACSRRSSCGA